MTQAAHKSAEPRRPEPARAAPQPLLLQRKCACGARAGAAGQCTECAGNAPPLQRRGVEGGGGGIPASVASTVASPGQPLDHATRSFMEPRFGANFGDVRVHTDGAAAQSARDADAHAYTVGQHVVFGDGQYQPHSESGRRLLAHELAHTLQQEGLQRSGIAGIEDHGPEYHRLEGEADRMADAALSGGAMPSWRGAERPTLSRAPRKNAPAAPPDAEAKKKKQLSVTSAYMSTTHEVTPEAVFTAGTAKKPKRQEAFIVDKLFVPGTKGPGALAMYQAMAAAGGLQATLKFEGGNTKAALWQERAGTSSLQSRWLNGVGWPGGKQADALWQAAGGDAVFPQVRGATCQMDHIVELQIGGNNTDQNIQPLDAAQNRDSGGAIKNQVFMLADQVAADPELASAEADQITLRFKAAEAGGVPETLPAACPPAGKAATCLAVDACARKAAAGAREEAAQVAGLVDFALSAGGANTALKVDKGFAKDRKAVVKIFEEPLNKSAAELIPGLILNKLSHGAQPVKQVDAEIDARDKTRLPITLDGKQPPVRLHVEPDGKLKVVQGTPNIHFTYKYLSPGVITRFGEAGGRVRWEGNITPQKALSFLGRLDVVYDNGSLTISKGLDKVRSPVPGAKLTKATLGIALAPEFKPTGQLEFEFGTTRKLAAARVDASADASGLVLAGKVDVFLPGVDKATGDITFRDRVWSGEVVVAASALQSKLKFVKGGEVRVGLAGGKLDARGKVQLALPGENEAELELGYRNERYLLDGRGKFKVKSPYLTPIDARLTYDGDLLRAKGKAGFAFKNILSGTIDATYENRNGDEKVFGQGDIQIDKGRAKGSIHVELHPNQRITGKGTLSYEIRKGMVATAGITVDEQQKITFDGELTLPDIPLFKRFPDVQEKTSIFTASMSIPIPALSIGPVGVKVKVYGGLHYFYYAGPGVLTKVRAAVKFSPFEPEPDFVFKLNATASIPAGGGIGGKVGADLVLDALVAEAGGGVSVEANAELLGKAELQSEINYAKERFSVDASAYIGGKVMLTAGLNAHVYAEAGVWGLKVRTEKIWELGKASFDTGLSIGVRLPLRFDSVDGFRMPALADIKPEPAKLDVDPGRLFDKLLGEAKTTTKES